MLSNRVQIFTDIQKRVTSFLFINNRVLQKSKDAGLKAFFLVCLFALSSQSIAADRVLVFHKVSCGYPFIPGGGFYHSSIEDGKEALQEIGLQNGWDLDLTDNSDDFYESNLAQYDVVVWLNTTGNNLLNEEQKQAFQQYIENGGGFVGIHAAADANYNWPWYGETLLAGAWFDSHPAIQEASINIEDNSHAATQHFGSTWAITDEWYNYRNNPRSDSNVLMSLDESSYSGGNMGDHPITWQRNVGLGRSFYTGLGHQPSIYRDANFIKMLTGGLAWAGNISANENNEGTPALDKTFFGVNAAGQNYTVSNESANVSSTKSITFLADQYFNLGLESMVRKEINGTSEQNLYRSHRWWFGSFEYDIPLENGDYSVTLKFADTFFSREDQRIFDVKAEDKTVIESLDVVKKVGADTAYDETHQISVEDGVLNLKFIGLKQNPMVSAIEIRKVSDIELGQSINLGLGSSSQYASTNSNNTSVVMMPQVAREYFKVWQ